MLFSLYFTSVPFARADLTVTHGASGLQPVFYCRIGTVCLCSSADHVWRIGVGGLCFIAASVPFALAVLPITHGASGRQPVFYCCIGAVRSCGSADHAWRIGAAACVLLLHRYRSLVRFCRSCMAHRGGSLCFTNTSVMGKRLALRATILDRQGL